MALTRARAPIRVPPSTGSIRSRPSMRLRLTTSGGRARPSFMSMSRSVPPASRRAAPPADGQQVHGLLDGGRLVEREGAQPVHDRLGAGSGRVTRWAPVDGWAGGGRADAPGSSPVRRRHAGRAGQPPSGGPGRPTCPAATLWPCGSPPGTSTPSRPGSRRSSGGWSGPPRTCSSCRRRSSATTTRRSCRSGCSATSCSTTGRGAGTGSPSRAGSASRTWSRTSATARCATAAQVPRPRAMRTSTPPTRPAWSLPSAAGSAWRASTRRTGGSSTPRGTRASSAGSSGSGGGSPRRRTRRPRS